MWKICQKSGVRKKDTIEGWCWPCRGRSGYRRGSNTITLTRCDSICLPLRIIISICVFKSLYPLCFQWKHFNSSNPILFGFLSETPYSRIQTGIYLLEKQGQPLDFLVVVKATLCKVFSPTLTFFTYSFW